MKKSWNAPELEVLSVTMTMAGPGFSIEDDFQNDPDEPDHYS
ncbi:paeninodin family lasso peptide [Psychrobacillus sp. NPDC096426]